MTSDRRGDAAEEARNIVLRTMGNVAGHTIKSQLRQAARNLGYSGDAWRPREALYRRAGGWSAAALDDLRQRFAAWRSREAGRSNPDGLAHRLEDVRVTLATLARQVDELAAELTSVST